MTVDAISLAVFKSLYASVAEEMGVTLRRASFSPNIKERLDYSCAVFDGRGRMVAQAAHIPVHLGSMAYAMRDLVARLAWAPDDMVIVNDPYLGGTHLPDVTVITPVFRKGTEDALFFVASRGHHAEIGGTHPGSVPPAASLATT